MPQLCLQHQPWTAEGAMQGSDDIVERESLSDPDLSFVLEETEQNHQMQPSMGPRDYPIDVI